MALHLNNVRIDNCVTGISAPKDSVIHANGLEITNTKHAIELRDSPGLMQSIGLPAETPALYLIEALKILEGLRSAPQEERIARLRESSLVKWLGVSADITGLATTLLSAQTRGLVSSVVEHVFG